MGLLANAEPPVLVAPPGKTGSASGVSGAFQRGEPLGLLPCSGRVKESAYASLLAECFLPDADPSQAATAIRHVPVIAACHFRWPWALSNLKPDIALVALTHSPSLRWHLRQHSAGISPLHMLTSSPQLRWLLPIVMPLVTRCRHQAGTFLGTVLVSLPASRWHLPALCWRCCPCRAGVPASISLAASPSTCWHRCLCCAGIIALVFLASSHWRCCLPHIVIVEPASLSALRWCPCEHCAGVVTFVVLTS